MKTTHRKNQRNIMAALMSAAMIASVLIPVSASAEEVVTSDMAVSAVSCDVTDATRFVFTDNGIEVTEGSYSGYKIDGTSLSIKDGGTYVVSGSCTDGTIVVKKNVTDVTLVLDGLTLSASATAPVTRNKGSEVTIVAAAETVTTLADDKYNNDDLYTDETLYPDIENAVIKCKDGSNVTIAGTGMIRITANGKNGIKGGYDLYEEDADGNATDTLLSTASLTLRDVTLLIEAPVNDALKSDKELNILSGNLTISAADDAIKSDYVLNIGAEGTDGPTITITKSTEGIEAAILNVYSGHITVNATDDGINAANSDLGRYSFSYNQYGGDVYVNVTAGDGVDSNCTIRLIGGTLEVCSPAQGDGDPLDADGGTSFEGATVLAVGHLAMRQGYTASTPYVVFGSSTGGMTGGFGRMGGFGGMQGNTAAALVNAGDTIEITDAAGKVLYTANAIRSASYVLFSSPDLTSGSVYMLKSGGSGDASGTATVSAAGGMGTGGQLPGGDSRGQDGGRSGNQGRMPGMGGFGGMNPGFGQAPPSGEAPTSPSAPGEPGDAQTPSQRPASQNAVDGGEGNDAIPDAPENDNETAGENWFWSLIRTITRFFRSLFGRE